MNDLLPPKDTVLFIMFSLLFLLTLAEIILISVNMPSIISVLQNRTWSIRSSFGPSAFGQFGAIIALYIFLLLGSASLLKTLNAMRKSDLFWGFGLVTLGCTLLVSFILGMLSTFFNGNNLQGILQGAALLDFMFFVLLAVIFATAKNTNPPKAGGNALLELE